MKRIFSLALVASLIAAPAVMAEQIRFYKSWKEQKFSLFSKNKYSVKGGTLGVASDGAVSMAYRAVPEGLWGASKVSWKWNVTESVLATDLRKKGGDDRNLTMYVVFLPEAETQKLKGAGIRKLLGSNAARVLAYVWGGNHGRGQMLGSPYLGDRGKTVVLRNAGTGSYSESVNLANDYKRAFGGTKGAVVGIAVSADSADTKSKVRGAISGLALN